MTITRRDVALAFVLGFAAPSGPAMAAPAAIDEGRFVDIDGAQQWIAIRGEDRTKTVILMLHGGPGIGISSMAPLFADWEKDFTLVLWDQPGGGGTGMKNADPGELSIAGFTRDGIAVAEYARRQLGVRKMILMGTSWGSLLGLEMVHARPDLFSAYVGTSQPIGPEGNRTGYDLALKAARTRNDAAAVAALERVGPPPYEKFEDLLVRQRYAFPPGLPPSAADAAATADMMTLLTAPPPAGAAYIAPIAPPAGYDPMKQFFATQQGIWKETWAWDAHHLGTTYAVPMFIFQGSDDINTPGVTVRAWLDGIHAPKKKYETVPGAGHNIIAFHSALLTLLKKDVLPVVGKSGGG